MLLFYRLKNLKDAIKTETKIDIESQLVIFNNLLIDSLVTSHQPVETYPIMDRQHPCVLFSLSSALTCDNLEIIKPSKPYLMVYLQHYSFKIFYTLVPSLSFKDKPKKTAEILGWSKETCGIIYYIKREVYMVTNIIELLKLSAIALK